MNNYEYEQLFSKIFDAVNYLRTMTVYHIVALCFFFAGITGFNLQTFVGIDETLLNHSKSILAVLHEHNGITSILIICALIMFMDMIFLCILSYDFRSLRLTWSKICKIEAVLFTISVLIPATRAILLFMTWNTLQIFVFYHIAIFLSQYKMPNPLKYIIVSVGYWMMIKIIVYPLGVVL